MNASKEKLGRVEALALAEMVSRVVAARGKSVVVLDQKKERPDEETLAGHLLGRSGNLRAPTLRAGKTLYVGFNEAAYRELVE